MVCVDDVRHDVYLTLCNGIFNKGTKRADKNVQIDVEVLNDKDQVLEVRVYTYLYIYIYVLVIDCCELLWLLICTDTAGWLQSVVIYMHRTWRMGCTTLTCSMTVVILFCKYLVCTYTYLHKDYEAWSIDGGDHFIPNYRVFRIVPTQCIYSMLGYTP